MLVVGRSITSLVLAVALIFFLTSYWRSTSPPLDGSSGKGQHTGSFVFEHADLTRGNDDFDAGHDASGSSSKQLQEQHPTGGADYLEDPAVSEQEYEYYDAGQDDPPRVSLSEYMRDMLKWDRPLYSDGHFPQYQDYADRDYDPNRWEGFETERGYYYRSGSRQFQESHSAFERVYSPYPDYQSAEYRARFAGDFVACEGARGRLLNESMEDAVHVFDSVPNMFPAPFVGSADAVGLHGGMCMDRVQRYGPYGLEPLLRYPISYVDWKKVRWGHLQLECVAKNQDRFGPVKNDAGHYDLLRSRVPGEKRSLHDFRNSRSRKNNRVKKSYVPRTAVLIRTWEGYEYTENDIMAIRAMVTELSLQSGGEYQVFLMVNVKDRSQPILTSEEAYNQMLMDTVPTELQDIALLWNEEICERMYPDVGDWQVYWQQFMPIQWFSETHPEFEYVWNWEMDVRYIGNHYHFLNQVTNFAYKQPRKFLWERNARIYIPEHHGGDFSAYTNATNALIADSAAQGIIDPVWGPRPFSPQQTPLGPQPPHSMAADNFSWGVGEEADFISLLPIFDPAKTSWTMRNKVWNFTPGIRPQFSNSNPTDDNFDHRSLRRLPRRGFINTVVRMSRRLLHAMHTENLAGRSMQAEMWPSSVALHHGFKAVYVPQPVYSAKRWPARYADAVFNADGGRPARWGQEADSIYNQDREVNFRPWSWYYHAEFPRILYRRYMGWKAEDPIGDVGGQDWERTDDDGPGGRMCLPPMLLHPVKRRDLEGSKVS